jgi:hypothetical protein
VQRGATTSREACAVVEMGGRTWQEEELHGATESYIRSLYDHYRSVMDL